MKIKLILLLFVLSISSSYAQKIKLASADKKYDELAYIDAIEIYKKVAEKGHKSVDLFQKLGNSSYAKCNLDKAAKWYRELFALTTDLEPEYYYRYAESLRSISLYQEADALIEKLKTKVPVKKKA